LKAIGWINRKHSLDHFSGAPLERTRAVRKPGWRSVEAVKKKFDHHLAFVWKRAGEHFKKDRAECIDLTPNIFVGTEQALWWNATEPSPTRAEFPPGTLIKDRFRKPAQLERVRIGQQKIAWMKVAMV
jgi:hypothetical protein